MSILHIDTLDTYYTFSHKLETFIYDPERLTVFSTPTKVSCHYQRKKKDLINQYIDKTEKKIPAPTTMETKNTQDIKFHVSNDCNLRCSYCYADGGCYGNTRGKMSEETIKKGVEFLKQLAPDKKQYNVQFFGGEPLMFIDDMLKVKETLESEQKVIKYSLITNGTIHNPKVESFFKKSRSALAISMDGTQKVHDKYRFFANGQGSHKYVVKNFEKFRQTNPNILVQVTVSKGGTNLIETFEHLKSLQARNILFKPVAADKESPFGLSEDEFIQLESEYTKLADHYYNYILNNDDPVIISDFVKNLKALVLQNKNELFLFFWPQ